jgi:hypothetical protein
VLTAAWALAALAGGPPAFADASATVSTGAGTNGQVVQVFDLRMPGKFSLNFRWCDGLTCGDAAPECYSNKWIPSFDTPSIELRLPPASPGRGDFEPIHQVIVQRVGEDDRVLSTIQQAMQQQNEMNQLLRTIELNQNDAIRGILQNLRAHKDDSGRLCGLTDEEKKGFEQEFGLELDNTGNEHLRVTVIWNHPEQGSTLPPALLTFGSNVLNSGHEGDAAFQAMEIAGLDAAYPGFRQDDGTWSDTRMGGHPFDRTGSLPTTLANLLAGGGQKTDPGLVGQELFDRGTWKPGTGTPLNAMRDFLTFKQLTVQETTLLGALGQLQVSGTKTGSVLVAYTDTSGKSPQENVALLTGYDPGRDRVTVLDPARGSRTIPIDQLAAGNPYLFQVATQQQQQMVQTATAAIRSTVDAQTAIIRNVRP